MLRLLALSTVLVGALSGPGIASQVCEEANDLARTIMTKRQDGHPLGQTLEIVRLARGHEPTIRLVRSVILQAYEFPIVADENREFLISEYGNRWHLNCELGFPD